MNSLALFSAPAFKRWGPVALVWSCLLLLPFGRLVEIPVALMAVLGAILLIRHWRDWSTRPQFSLFTALFLLLWLPMLISLVDALYPPRTLEVCVNHLRFYFAGLFILHCLALGEAHDRLLRACAWLIALWVADALIQWIVGKNLLGYEIPHGRINGIFGEHRLGLSTTLAVLCPLWWEHARRHWPTWAALAAVVATVMVVLAAGTRSAWINIVVLMVAYGALIWWRRRRVPLRGVALASVALVLGGLLLFYTSERFAERIDRTVAAFTGEAHPVKDPIGHRAWIWKGALRMFRANPVNGVGARGFRYAYAEHASEDDPYLKLEPPILPTHSHNMWLEVLSETGTIGALGLALLFALLVVTGVRVERATQRAMLPYALCLLAALFPFNTHLAIYSSFSSQILWWLIALYVAAYGGGSRFSKT